MGWTLLVLLYVAAGVGAAWEARRKGYDDLLFLVIGVVLGPIAFIGMWFLPRKALAVGTPVRPAAKITLDDGSTIPTSHVTVVRATKIIDGEQVCLVTSRTGSQHWVAQEALSRMRSLGR